MEQQFEENLAEQFKVSSAVDTFIASYLTSDAFGLLAQTYEVDCCPLECLLPTRFSQTAGLAKHLYSCIEYVSDCVWCICVDVLIRRAFSNDKVCDEA